MLSIDESDLTGQPDASAPRSTDETEIRLVDDIHEMVGMVELSDVYLWEERGRRVEEPASEADEAPRIRNELNVADGNDRLGIGFRFRTTVDDRCGNDFLADFQARYDLPEPVKFNADGEDGIRRAGRVLRVLPLPACFNPNDRLSDGCASTNSRDRARGRV